MPERRVTSAAWGAYCEALRQQNESLKRRVSSLSRRYEGPLAFSSVDTEPERPVALIPQGSPVGVLSAAATYLESDGIFVLYEDQPDAVGVSVRESDVERAEAALAPLFGRGLVIPGGARSEETGSIKR